MSQRDSGYERKERGLYETPGWVTEALLPHLPLLDQILEPACGSGQMARVLSRVGMVIMGDIEPLCEPACRQDFLSLMPGSRVDGGCRIGIVTNPPYDLATEFCEHALRLMEPVNGMVAMLLRTDFYHAKSRSHLFRDCPAFAKKLVLMKRIAWFVEDDGKPKASPSFNHAWYIWDWKHSGPPTIAYGS
jgi:hypothetical protein